MAKEADPAEDAANTARSSENTTYTYAANVFEKWHQA
jgi:hypothetical protein